MMDNFKATMDSGYYSNSKRYWKVTIEANDLDELNNLVAAINTQKIGRSEND